jgi:hypothetical protein
MYGGGYYGEQAGWRLTYLSPTRNEMLSFFVTPQKTLIVRMRWAPLTLSPESVTVDSASAIKKLIAAIEDKSARGEEEKSGLDYFLGTPFDQPKTPNGDDNYSKAEVVYDVPDKVRWNVSLQSVMGRMVWELNYYGYEEMGYGGGVIAASTGTAVAVAAPAAEAKFALQSTPAIMPMPRPMPSSQPGQPGEWRESYFQNNARGMIDAQTGAVIRFTRPVRHFYRDWSYQPTPMPSLMPKPSPVPSTAPTKEPEVVDPEVVEGNEGTGETDTGTDTANN